MAEAVDQLALEDDAIVVNLQGDIPSISPQVVEQVACNLQQHPKAVAATLCYPLSKPEDALNPNIVKVVRDQQGFALYFSRAPIPWQSAADKMHDEVTMQHKHLQYGMLPVHHPLHYKWIMDEYCLWKQSVPIQYPQRVSEKKPDPLLRY